jgi:PKD repeat protein
MRTTLLVPVLAFILHAGGLLAQTAPGHGRQFGVLGNCGFDILQHAADSDPATREERKRIERELYRLLDRGKPAGGRGVLGSESYVIPVVVHIIHDNGPENISDDDVKLGIRHLNEAFANIGAYDSTNGVSIGIEFCLAKQDELGRFTTGITRTQSPLTEMTMESDDGELKNLSRWDTKRYLNIWLVREITSRASGPGVSGYAYPLTARGGPRDGVVNEARLFAGNTDQAKIHVHEVGHYLGLYHTFQGACGNDDCLQQGDYICDTPPDATSSPVPCEIVVNSCHDDDADHSVNNPFRPVSLGGVGDQPDMSNDYMDYGLQGCLNSFTEGQRLRMIAVLTHERQSLLASVGCINPCRNQIQARFSASSTLIDAGTPLVLANLSTGATSFLWKKDGAPFSSQLSPQITFTTQGTYTITLVASNDDPACTAEDSLSIVVRCPITSDFSMSASSIQPGGRVTFTMTSGGGVANEWFIDGESYGTAGGFSHIFPVAGGYQVYLVTFNGTCYDTVKKLIKVGDCRNSKEGNVWYFGQNAALDFNEGTPKLIPDRSHLLREGISSICNSHGSLLMYADGEKVWNRAGAVMQNGDGLGGSSWSAQSCVIVPAPKSDSLYYIFTVSNWTDIAPALRYSIVDMSRDGGFGAVITKGVLLDSMVSERVAAVFHEDCEDIWIVSHEMGNHTFVAFRLLPEGVDTVPVRSNVGGVSEGTNRYGGLKFSPSGRKLGSALGGSSVDPTLEVFNFDPGTGIVSHPLTLAESGWLPNAYSCEFSPDENLFYACGIGERYIYQYDLRGGLDGTIRASRFTVSMTGDQKSGLQLGPDGVIYIAKPEQPFLGAITLPNIRGAGCTYRSSAIPMSGKTCLLGLPNGITGYTMKPLTVDGPATVCGSDSGVIYRSHGGWCARGRNVWSVTGPATLAATPQGDAALSFTGRGTVSLTLENQGTCGSVYDTTTITVLDGVRVDLGPDTVFCSVNGLTLDAGSLPAHYKWSDGSTGRTLTVHEGGRYWVKVASADGCTATDTIEVTEEPIGSDFSLGPDRSICGGEVAVIDAGPGYSAYRWQDGTDGRYYTAYTTGEYWVTVERRCGGPLTDTIALTSGSRRLIDLGADILVCSGDTVKLGGSGAPGLYYFWSTGDTTPTIGVTEAGRYWAIATDGICQSADTVDVGFTQGGAMLELPDLTATPVAPGQEIAVPLRLTVDGRSPGAGMALSFRLRFNGTLFRPVAGMAPGELRGGERTIRIDATTTGSDTVAIVRLQGLLGDALVTDLTVDSVELASICSSGLIVRDGRMAVTVCSGRLGSRLVKSGGALKLAVRGDGSHGDPIEVSYDLIEQGVTRLRLVDALGRSVRIVAEGGMEPGSYMSGIDPAALPSGSYFLRLETPTSTVTRRVVIRK